MVREGCTELVTFEQRFERDEREECWVKGHGRCRGSGAGGDLPCFSYVCLMAPTHLYPGPWLLQHSLSLVISGLRLGAQLVLMLESRLCCPLPLPLATRRYLNFIKWKTWFLSHTRHIPALSSHTWPVLVAWPRFVLFHHSGKFCCSVLVFTV